MNKYRGMNIETALPAPLEVEKLEGKLDRGIVLFRPPQDIELSMSPDSDCVRVVEGGLRQDFDLTELSSATALAILSLGEHRYVVTGSETFEATFRFLEKASSLIKIESWNGLTWGTEIDTDDWTVESVLLSYRSYLATAFFADGKRVLKWIQTTSFVAQSDEFEAAGANNPLTAVDDTVDAAIVPAASVDDEYNVHYSVDVDGPCGAGSYVDVAILDDGAVELVVIRHSIPVDSTTGRSYTLPHETAEVVDSIASGENLTLKLKAINAVGVLRELTLTGPGGGPPQWEATKSIAREAVDDEYIFEFSLTDAGGGDPTSAIEFYYDTGAGWVLHEAVEFAALGGIRQFHTITRSGLGASDKLGIHVPAGDQADYDIVIALIDYNESFEEEVSIKGFNLATDSDPSQGVTYQTEGTPTNELREVDQDPAVTPNVSGATATSGGTKTITDTGAGWSVNTFADDWVEITAGTGSGQFRKILSNTSDTLTVGEDWATEPDATSVFDIFTPVLLPARYLGIFADRVIALQVDEDPQKIGWCVNGDPTDWVNDGSGTSILRSHSVDPIDELLALAVLTSNVAALFRRRSIMRVLQTGVATNALGFHRWLENLGTESPFSPFEVPGGIMFLGHDKQVYYLTEQGPTPVSQFIQEELESSIGDLGVVEGTYDATTQNYILAVPGLAGSNTAITWLFDFGRMIAEQVLVWQRRTEVMNRLAIAGSKVTFAGADGIVRQFDTANPCGGYWVSPMLNRGNREADYSIVQVILRYQAEAATTLVVEASNDGGVTWTAGNKATLTLTATTKEGKRAVQGFQLGGYDLRFRITFPTDEIVTILSWRADLVERGDLGAE